LHTDTLHLTLPAMGIAAIDLAKIRAPSVVERWYVLTLMCLIYAVNIADRYVVSHGARADPAGIAPW